MMSARRIDNERTPTSRLVQVSMLEIYNEHIIDLLSTTAVSASAAAALEVEAPPPPASSSLTVNDGISSASLTVRLVTTQAEVEAIMAQGAINRTVGCTLANERSSRSHSLLIVDVLGASALDPTADKTKGRLVLVDLACVAYLYPPPFLIDAYRSFRLLQWL